MLGLQKYAAQGPLLHRSGVRAIATTSALLVFGVLAFLNSEISPRTLPSLENAGQSSSGFPPSDNTTTSELHEANSIMGSTPLASKDDRIIRSPNFSAMPENTSDTAVISLISVPKKVNQKSYTRNQELAITEVSSCESRKLPVLDRKTRTSPVSIGEMEQILSNNRQLSCSKIPLWSSSIDKQILRARREIENTVITKKRMRLYAPVFKNISMFKRSYELMEKTLKVYVYKEGEMPIFHSPYLRGIYSSESWFMKNMEEGRRFRTQDPTKAHLFYLPFSSKILCKNLYISDSHSHKNIVQYLKNYVEDIAAKYPFWNRTGGADHFLVGCHDWAPLETEIAMGNTIRALCNADLSNVFELGKDISFPQTNIFDSKNPEMGLGGYPARERSILAFFAGKMHGYLRPKLLEKWGNGDPDIKVFGPLGRKAHKENTTMSYSEYMKRSKFCLCPRGFEVSSPRVTEAIFHECVPVIISDNFVPPFFEILKWEEFSVFIKEEDIPQLKEILRSISWKKYLSLQASVRKVQKHFVWHDLPQRFDAFHMTLHSVWFNRVFQFKAC